MEILKAEHLGMCFGVRDAIDLAIKTAQEEPLTILGELVHNPQVSELLKKAKIGVEENIQRVTTRRVMVTAHGTSDRQREKLSAEGWDWTEATCPLVKFAHQSLRRLVEKGYHPVVIGRKDHIEVRGLTGDWPQAEVILSEEEIGKMPLKEKYGVIAQTTQPIQRVRQLVQKIKEQFPSSEVRFQDTVCQPTKQRQLAARKLAAQCDVVLVIGGSNSNNTRELVNTCLEACHRVFHVQNPSQIRDEWLEGAEVVGITAGTSTTDDQIHSIEARLREFMPAPVPQDW